MNAKKVLLALMAVLALNWACSSDDSAIGFVDALSENSDTGTPGDATGPYQEVVVGVTLPAGSPVDLAGSSLYSMGVNSPLNRSGGGVVPFNPGTVEIAYLFDSEEEVILAGFLTDDRKEVSVATTVEVMLYFAMLNPLRSTAYKKAFAEQIGNNPIFTNLVAELEPQFAQNPRLFSDDAFFDQLNEVIGSLTNSKTIDIGQKASFDPIAKSGININDVAEQTFSLTNSYPRRAHAFLYIKSYKDQSGNETVVNQVVDGSDTPTTTLSIPFSRLHEERNEDLQGQVLNYVFCTQGARYQTKTSAEKELDLIDGRTSETYELAVVGPGRGAADRALTDIEEEKLEELTIETFVMDYFIPILMDIGGNRDIYSTKDLQQASAIADVVAPILKSHNPSYDAVMNQDFEAAINEFFPFLYGDIRLSNDLRNILSSLYELIDDGSSPNSFIQNQELIQEGEIRSIKITAFLIRSMKESVGIPCINKRLGVSATLESWDIVIREGKVKLNPETVNTVPFDEPKQIRATVFYDLQDGEEFEFEWSTTSRFGGVLNDYEGQDGTSFTTKSDRVAFFSNASTTQLGDGDNLEQVTVKAFVVSGSDRDEIGEATIDANVKKKRFEITPDGITIDGNDQLVLRLRHTDGVTAIPNDEYDYKIEWRCLGNHGLLLGLSTRYFEENRNTIEYHADDTETVRGEEEFQALIYARRKGTNEPYKLIDDPEATITIENDEQVVYDYVNVSVRTSGPTVTGDFTSFGVATVWAYEPWADNDPRIPEGYKVESYSIRIIERIPDLIPSCTRSSGFWRVDEDFESRLDSEGTLSVTCGVSGVSSPTWLWDGSVVGQLIAGASATKGYAQVTIRLIPREAD